MNCAIGCHPEYGGGEKPGGRVQQQQKAPPQAQIEAIVAETRRLREVITQLMAERNTNQRPVRVGVGPAVGGSPPLPVNQRLPQMDPPPAHGH